MTLRTCHPANVILKLSSLTVVCGVLKVHAVPPWQITTSGYMSFGPDGVWLLVSWEPWRRGTLELVASKVGLPEALSFTAKSTVIPTLLYAFRSAAKTPSRRRWLAVVASVFIVSQKSLAASHAA